MPNRNDTAWTPFLEDRLRELWVQESPQLSAQEIGRLLGMTKNAIIGKARRLALAARPSPIRGERRKPPVPKPVVQKQKPAANDNLLKEPAMQTMPAQVAVTPPVSPPLLSRFVAFAPAPREQYGCRWIDGDPRQEWRYCDAPRSALGGSYCDRHRARAYMPVKRAG